MSKLLRASILANLVLCLTVLWLVRPAGNDLSTSTNPGMAPARHPNDRRSEPASAANSVRQNSFRWSQLESTDYRQYLANLRAIGCPEQTVRDIITADVASLYDRRRNELKGGSIGTQTENAQIQTDLEKLAQEQAAVLLALLGPKPGGESVGRGSSPPRFVRHQSDRIALPLALQTVDLAELNFSPRQLAAVADARQRFQQEVQSAGLAPTDPAYRALWLKAQAESDDLLQAMIGGERFIDYQLAARNAALAIGSRN